MEGQMSKRNFIIILTLFYLFLYVILKLIIVFTQDLFMNHEVYDKTYNIGDVLKITSQDYNGEMFQVSFSKHSIQMKNIFAGFEEEEKDNNYQSFALYGDDNLVRAVFIIFHYIYQIL